MFDPKWAAVNDLTSVWSSTSLCGTPVGTPNPLREAMASQWSNTRAIIIDAFVNKSNCSMHDVTMVSTVKQQCARVTITAAAMCEVSAQGAGDTLLLLTVITKVLVECIIEPAHLHGTCSGLCACQNLMEQSKENVEIGIIILPYRQHLFIAADIMVITNRKESLHFKFHNGIEYIRIQTNIFSFSFIYGILKTKYLNNIAKKISHRRRRGGMFDNGNINWCMLGRAFLCRTGGHFCVEPGIFVSSHAFCNRAFLCRTSVIIS